jgi:hypothetical protein
MQVLGSVLNGQLGVVARIAALRHSSPAVSPQVPTLIAAEFPSFATEATLRKDRELWRGLGCCAACAAEAA